ncbi:PAS domain S-box protein [Aneurinibacillus sp. REN35]|uniref:PAS domain S-box protein n=1 Tax=Aneurinibacillus sp. REN35 TaxID=3237286 RepID=UPI003526E212
MTSNFKPYRIPLLYVLFSTMYLMLSDTIVVNILQQPSIVFWMHFTKAIVFTLLTGCILYFVIRRALTSIQLSKQALEEKESQLRESEQLYRRLVELSPDIIIVHQQSKCLFVNQSGARMLGYEAQELVGTSLFDHVHPDYHEVVKQRIQSMHEGQCDLEPIEEKIICKDGTIIDVDIAATSIQYNHQAAVMAVIRDITDKKKTEDALRKADTLSIAGSLAAGVAHEIRNPLTVLKGFIQLVNEGNDKRCPYSNIMLSEVDRIETIIGDFLMLAKPQHVQFKKNSLQEIIQHTIILFETQAIMKKTRIIPSYDPDLPLVDCEANQLKQVCINILKNALEAMPDGGEIHVRVLHKTQDHIMIRFSDQGIGISPEKINKLGEPFYTTKEKGTGLGLMVSYNIIKNHHGEIEVYSEPGVGTTFDIILPVSSCLSSTVTA